MSIHDTDYLIIEKGCSSAVAGAKDWEEAQARAEVVARNKPGAKFLIYKPVRVAEAPNPVVSFRDL